MSTLKDDGTAEAPRLKGRRAQGWAKGKPTDIELAPIDERGHELEASAALAYLRMAAEAERDGVVLVVNSAWRDHAHQERLYRDYRRKMDAWDAGKRVLPRPPPVAVPGFSRHESGLAVDVESGGGGNEAFTWLTARAGEYGFRRTVASEPWHWEWSGVSAT